MKKRILSTLVLATILLTAVAFAKYIDWKPEWRPPVSITEALDIATKELKRDKKEDYYCINATIGRANSEGDWIFVFANEKGLTYFVMVSSKKTIQKSERGFDF